MHLANTLPVLLLLGTLLPLEAAELRLPAVFTDHAVLQRDRSIPVWGWADAGTTVTASFDGTTASANAGADGHWMLRLPAHPTGGPFELTVSSTAGASRTITDLLVGEVWLCSGQSNMEFPVEDSLDSAKEIAAAGLPRIRLLRVPHEVKAMPVDDIAASWAVCSPETVGTFSGVGFFFGRELAASLDVPIGLIDACWGGTTAEAWTVPAWLEADPAFREIVARWETRPLDEADFTRRMAEWRRQSEFEDPGLAATAQGWEAPGLVLDQAWREMPVPGMVEQQDIRLNGAFWFRREVVIPAAWAGRELRLDLGPIDDFDITWFDGQEIGRTGKETANWWQTPRRYVIPASRVRAGSAVIAVRIWDRFLGGGFGGDAVDLRLAPADEPAAGVGLAGRWRFCIEQSKPEPGPAPVDPSELANAPGHLWHSMIRPLVPFGLRGAIWYQGEANTGRAEQYARLLPTMIDSWRTSWGQGDLPFYIVSLANFRERAASPKADEWAELRDAQDATARLVRNSGLAVAIDLGDAADIHPRNKQEVGRRLALQALRNTYGKAVAAQGPQLAACSIDGPVVRLRFTEAAGLATSDGKAPRGFALAGADRRFVWATSAVIEGDCVVLSADGLAAPVAARYGWAANPDVNLVNGAGLPAPPCRTDLWPGSTTGRR